MVALRGQLNLIETSPHGKVRGGLATSDMWFYVFGGAVGVCKSVRVVGRRSDGIPNRDVLGEWRADGLPVPTGYPLGFVHTFGRWTGVKLSGLHQCGLVVVTTPLRLAWEVKRFVHSDGELLGLRCWGRDLL